MTYNDLVQYYQAHVPPDPSAPLGTDAGNQRFNSWTSQLEKELGIPGGNYDDPSSGWASIKPEQLDQFETQGGGGAAKTLPLEQGILQGALPGLIGDINGDAGRRTIAAGLASSVLGGAAAANTQLARATGGHFDGNTYFQKNPDVAAAYQQQGGQQGTGMSVDQFAEKHFLENGQREGRQPAYIQSAQLAQDFNNANQTTAANIAAANQATQAQLGALATATTAMQQNLQGNLAAKAAALAQQVASLNQNLDTLSAAQKAALAQQIGTMQQDLEQSIATQRQALHDQIAALGTAATAEAAAKKASLEQEIQGLTAAQAPLNAARTAAADLQATAVNVGLQRTEDQLTANNARAGFVGGSTAQDSALARATIDARQGAAQAMGNANFENARDTRDIGFRGATGTRSIADALAEAQRQIAGQGANGNAALTGALATGRQQIGDYGATGLAGITNNTATTRAGIGAYGANTTYGNATTGADQSRTIADALAQGGYGLSATNAQQVQTAQNQGAAAKATYYDNDWNRSLAGSLAPTTIAGSVAGTLTGLDNYGASGLNRTLGTLGWWSTNPNPPPTPGAIATTAGTTGNSLSNLGSGLLSGAIGVGQANDWWKSAKPPSTVGVRTATGGPGD